ncbi:MAG: YCF48-related protein [Candidatus Thorarchaeota archaeon]
MMRRIIKKSITRLLAIGFLLVILTQSISGVVILANAIDGSPFIPSQNETTWEILEHEYHRPQVIPWDIAFVNVTHGWVLSQNETSITNGIILHTENGGESWYLQYYNASQRFNQIAIIDHETLWVAGVGGLFYTDNCGQNWTMKPIGSSNSFFYGVHFLNRTHGWTGSSVNMYKTIDGGFTWQPVSSWITSDSARMIYFTTGLSGWAIGFSGIYHSNDGGDTWELQFEKGGWALSFVSDTEAWAVADGWLAHMTDGETWVEQPMPRPATNYPQSIPYFTDILFLDANNGWIVGDETEVAYTPNGGLDWYAQEFPGDNRLTAIDFINLTHGWAVGGGGYIYRTTQGNSLGTHLWTGITNPIILLIAGASAAVVVVLSGAFILRKRRRGNKTIHNGVDIK